jgi:hypothetical protein
VRVDLSGGGGGGGGGASEGVAGAVDDADFTDEATVASFGALHDRVAQVPLDLKAGGGGPLNAAHGHHEGTYRAVPVLPLWWRHIAHSGVEELQ